MKDLDASIKVYYFSGDYSLSINFVPVDHYPKNLRVFATLSWKNTKYNISIYKLRLFDRNLALIFCMSIVVELEVKSTVNI